MLTDSARIKLLRELLAQRILVIDGAFGTYIQGLNFGPEDFGGPQFEGCNENVVLDSPRRYPQNASKLSLCGRRPYRNRDLRRNPLRPRRV